MILSLTVGLCVFVISSVTDAQPEPECSNASPCPLKGGSPLVRCPELVSKDGVLNVTLVTEIAIFKFEWLEIPRRSYNGLKCPETWRVKPGDTINVNLVNKLGGSPGDPKENITNLHTHGLHVSPLDPQDNVFLEVHPGESHRYSYKISKDHSPGTYWYHPHPHVASSVQMVGGMAGMLIVEDDPKNTVPELRAVSCPENCERDIPLILSPMLESSRIIFVRRVFGDSIRLPSELESWMKKNVNMFTVNGEVRPVISLTKNQLYRLRILNAGISTALELLVVNENNKVAPCEIKEIAKDGVYLDRPTLPRFGLSFLYSANRVDWLIKCSETGKFKLYSQANEETTMASSDPTRKTAELATIQVSDGEGTEREMEFPKNLPKRPRYLDDLTNVVPDQYITVELGGDFTMNREKYSDPTNYRYKVEEGSVVEIQLVNTWYQHPHPMHFHINHGQVMGFEPFTGPVSYYKNMNPNWELRDFNGELCDYQHRRYVKGAASREFNITDPLMNLGHYERWVRNENDSQPYPQRGDWLDTFLCPALSNLTIRMRMDKFTGPMAIHCHVTLDSDSGMMMVIEVVEKGGDLSGANVLSSGKYAPGSCKRCDWNRFLTLPPDCKEEEKRLPSDNVILNFLLSLLYTTRDARGDSPFDS